MLIWAVTKTTDGSVYRLRGSASLETTELQISADALDYDESAGEVQARGNVHLKSLTRGEEVWADEADYSLKNDYGRFRNVRGSSPVQVKPQPGLLTTGNPYYFEGRWAEKSGHRYILYDGFLTNCRLPKPWWVFKAGKFDILPGDRALARGASFRLRKVPLLYFPALYQSLEEKPRQSGFLTPSIGNSSRLGKMVGLGYYWAINRSFDATYRGQLYTARGVEHHVDFRGKPTAASEFNLVLYGMKDRGQKLDNGERRTSGGLSLAVEGKADLGRGFQARVEGNYVSSMRFRTLFTYSLDEAIGTEVHSIGYIQKNWSGYTFNIVGARLENIQNPGDYDGATQSFKPDAKVVIRKLPQAEFNMRDRETRLFGLPFWVSMESSAGLIRRGQPLFQTSQFVARADFQPRIMTALRWKGFSLLPSFMLRETHYDSRMESGLPVREGIRRHAREFALELALPPLARVYDGRRWLGDKVKHVIEPRAVFRHAAGIEDFEKLIRFDETELMTNTTEAEFSLTNRLYVKRGDEVHELASWQVWHARYFDPTFGGAVSAIDPFTGKPRRNVIASSANLTAFSFLDGPRRFSPIISALRISPLANFGLEWRSDYDTARHRPVNSWLVGEWHRSIYTVRLGHMFVRSGRQLSASANEFNAAFGIGGENRRGWNAGFDARYDFREGVMRWATSQVTYNTDCCGFSFQYQRMGLPGSSGNIYRAAFSVANIGSFGSLRRQNRLF